MDQGTIQPILEPVLKMDLSAWITAVATLVLAFLTFVYVKLTKRILESQSDPCVVLTVEADKKSGSLLLLVARNIGTGVAYDVRFEFSRPLPDHAMGHTRAEAQTPDEMKDGPFIDGIPALGPGESRDVYWGQIGGLSEALGETPINAVCKFKKKKKEMPPIHCPLEVNSFWGTIAEKNPTVEIVNELKNISQQLDRLCFEVRKMELGSRFST